MHRRWKEVAALHASKIILPAPAMIERAAIAGRARARKRAIDALLADVSAEQMAKIDGLLTTDPAPTRPTRGDFTTIVPQA
jgi:hypothetical protein